MPTPEDFGFEEDTEYVPPDEALDVPGNLGVTDSVPPKVSSVVDTDTAQDEPVAQIAQPVTQTAQPTIQDAQPSERELALEKRIAELEARLPKPETPEEDDGGAWGALARVGKGIYGSAKAVGRKAVDAAYGSTEDLVGKLVPEIDDGTGIPRTYAAGSAQNSIAQNEKAENAELDALPEVQAANGAINPAWDALNSAYNASRGAGRNFMSSFSDEAVSKLVPEPEAELDTNGNVIPREYVVSSSEDPSKKMVTSDPEESMASAVREQERVSRAEDPTLTAGGEVAGTIAQTYLGGKLLGPVVGAVMPKVVSAIPKIAPAIPKVVSAIGPTKAAIAANAASAALGSGAAAAGQADPGHRSGAALEGGATGAGVSAALSAAVPLAGAVAAPVAKAVAPYVEKGGEWARALANKATGGAAGVYGSDLTRIANEYPGGVKFATEELGENLNRLAPHKMPWSARKYYEEFNKIRGNLGAQRGEAVVAADKELPGVIDTQGIIRSMNARIGRLQNSTGKSKRLEASELRRVRDVFVKKHGDKKYLKPSELDEFKHEQEAEVWKGNSPIRSARDTAASNAAREAAIPARNALNENIEQLALPETAKKFGDANRDFKFADIAARVGANRTAKEAGNQALNLPTSVAVLSGISNAGSNIDPNKGIIDQLPSIGMNAAVGAGMGMLGGQALRHYGKDATAIAARGASGLLKSGASKLAGFNPANAIEDTLEAANPLGSFVGQKVATRGAAMQPAMAEESKPKAPPDTTSAIKWYLQNDYESLGPYAQDLSDAVMEEEGGDAAAVGSVIDKLSAESEFAKEIWPLIQKRSGAAK